jgi:acyl-coenzyme A thioesterase PaaI-like protein
MSPAFEPGDRDYEQRARESFARQGLLATLAAERRSIKPGAVGDFLHAHGEVARPGRNLTVCRGDAYAISGGGSKHVATILATMTGIAEAN